MSCAEAPNRRRVLLAALALPLLAAGCGFAPVYGPGGAGRVLQGNIRASDPVTRADQQFVQAFEDRLGRPEAGARFDLSYTFTRERTATGRRPGLGPTRELLTGTLAYTLSENGQPRATGEVSAETAHSTTATQLATLTATEDADLRLMRLLADAVAARLLADPSLAQ